jgi:hypothetical protein
VIAHGCAAMPTSPSAREREEWRREVALFRYTLVREPADPGLSNAERGRLVVGGRRRW